MSYAETSAETFSKFAATSTWRNAPLDVLAGDFFSISNESNLALNPGHYEEKDGKLWDPKRKENVVGSAVNADPTEHDITKQLEDWFLTSDSGIGLYISPRKAPTPTHPGYPEEQITFYRIGYELNPQTFETKKVLFFTSHQFKAHFRNPEDIRRFIFTEVDREESVLEMIDWLKRVSEKKVETTLGDVEQRQKQAEHYAALYKSGVSIETIRYDMQQTGFLGDNPIGCPAGGETTTTAIPVYTSTSTENYGALDSDNLGKRDVICPACRYKNRRPLNGYLDSCKNPDYCPDRSAIVC